MRIINKDALEGLKGIDDESIQCCVTSPPYWGLRDYGVDGQLGLEPTLDEYVAKMVEVFQEVKRVLRKDGTCWVNMGDAYAGGGRGGNPAESKHRKQAANVGSLINPSKIPANLKPKDMIGMPWRIAFALQQPDLKCCGCEASSHQSAWGKFPNGRMICPVCMKSKGCEISEPGWYLRSDIIWAKPNPMPESVTDRPTKSHEYIFLLTKSAKYYYDADAIKQDSLTGDMRIPKGSEGMWKMDGRSKEKRKTGLRKQDALGLPTYEGFNSRYIPPQKTNRRTIWNIPTQPYPKAHFATFPEKIPQLCILAGSKRGDMILDPFLGSGTTGLVAQNEGRECIGIELNPEYAEMARERTRYTQESLIPGERDG